MINRRIFISGLTATTLAKPAVAKSILDYSPWTDLLGQHLRPGSDGVTRVAYRSWKQQGRTQLGDFLIAMQTADIQSMSKAQQFAFWINLYNAKTIDVVLEHYPVSSIRDIDLGGGLFADGPWSASLLKIGGRELSLDDIENNILRKSWKDPRVHYAINCASLGCPNLQPEALSAKNAEAFLDKAATRYINNQRGVRIEGDGIIVSKLYKWFAGDFGSRTGLNAHWSTYAEAKLRHSLSSVPRILSYEYDWSLNDAG